MFWRWLSIHTIYKWVEKQVDTRGVNRVFESGEHEKEINFLSLGSKCSLKYPSVKFLFKTEKWHSKQNQRICWKKFSVRLTSTQLFMPAAAA